jgi:hypothetical protein
VKEGVTVGTGIAVNFVVGEPVSEIYAVCVAVCETVDEAEFDRVILDDTLELAVSVTVFVN